MTSFNTRSSHVRCRLPPSVVARARAHCSSCWLSYNCKRTGRLRARMCDVYACHRVPHIEMTTTIAGSRHTHMVDILLYILCLQCSCRIHKRCTYRLCIRIPFACAFPNDTERLCDDVCACAIGVCTFSFQRCHLTFGTVGANGAWAKPEQSTRENLVSTIARAQARPQNNHNANTYTNVHIHTSMNTSMYIYIACTHAK